jgi:WbqC-like protein family
MATRAPIHRDRGAVLVAHQPAYLPWPGYFSRLLDLDRLVLLDHVQFTKGGWQHRNYIRAPRGGPLRLTVPVRHRFGQPLQEVRVAEDRWQARHWRALTDSYAHAPYWSAYADRLEAIYRHPWTGLVEVNEALLRLLLDGFGLPVTLLRSSDLRPAGARTEMLADLCRRTGAQILRAGLGGAGYLDAAVLARAGVSVEIATYTTPPYPQPGAGFTAGLSAVDLLLQCGPHARDILASGSRTTAWRQTEVVGV